jgi:uncharacterized protein (DUF1697 family)
MMVRYLALLRGINVGTSGRIRMDALKLLIENAGFARVSTYIQSGNVLFDSDLPEQAAKEAIEHALKEDAGITTTAVLRTAEELDALIRNCPFSAEEIATSQAENAEGESFYVCLLKQLPSEQALIQLASAPPEKDAYVISGRTVYLLLLQGIRNSKLAIRLQRAFPDATMRNWNTITKLNDLANIPNGG